MHRVIFILFSPNEQHEGVGVLPDFFSLSCRPRVGLANVRSSFFRVGNQNVNCEKQQSFFCVPAWRLM